MKREPSSSRRMMAILLAVGAVLISPQMARAAFLMTPATPDTVAAPPGVIECAISNVHATRTATVYIEVVDSGGLSTQILPATGLLAKQSMAVTAPATAGQIRCRFIITGLSTRHVRAGMWIPGSSAVFLPATK